MNNGYYQESTDNHEDIDRLEGSLYINADKNLKNIVKSSKIELENSFIIYIILFFMSLISLVIILIYIHYIDNSNVKLKLQCKKDRELKKRRKISRKNTEYFKKSFRKPKLQ